MVGGPTLECASEKDPHKIDEPQTTGSTRTSLSAIFRSTVGIVCVLAGFGLFIRFLIRCATAFEPDAALPGKEVLVGTAIPLVLMFVAASRVQHYRPESTIGGHGLLRTAERSRR